MKIIFVNHICTRNGATLMLLYFLEWLEIEHPEIKVDILSVRGGALEQKFDKVAVNHFKFYKKRNFLIRVPRLILRKIGLVTLVSESLYKYETTFGIKKELC